MKNIKFDKIINMMGWYTDQVNGVQKEFNKAVKQLRTIQELAQRQYDERYDTDWDSMQSTLYEIWRNE